MKKYRETYVRNAEIAQLILLRQLYSLSGSRSLIFQGGTALRWCYGGSRFSEDLDFVTPLHTDLVRDMLKKMLKTVEREMVPHFGSGAMTTFEKTTREDTLKIFVVYHPVSSREKISVKLEFEGIRKDILPDTKNFILSALPAVSYLITTGEFRIPRPTAVLVAETPQEVLSDKIRALLERRYLKGRDIFDIWYLRTVLNAAVSREIIERKFTMYAWPFKAARHLDFFANPSLEIRDEMIGAIREDLYRFLPREVFAVHQAEGFASFINELQTLFNDMIRAEVKVP